MKKIRVPINKKKFRNVLLMLKYYFSLQFITITSILYGTMILSSPLFAMIIKKSLDFVSQKQM